MKVSLRQPAAADCILNVETSSLSVYSSCHGGYWGGFLSKNCSRGAFCHYLFALAPRANQTGKFFLNSSEQRKCWSRMKTDEADVSGCGRKKLTAGVGGCSDFSTRDVSAKLGYTLERLKGKCGLSSADEWGENSCASCQRSWKEIKGIHSEVCSFAVLVTLASTGVKNELWVSKLYNCLGNQQVNKDFEAEEHAQKKKLRIGLCILIGVIVGHLVGVVVFSILVFKQRGKTPVTPFDKDAWRAASSNFPAPKPALCALLKESEILKVSVKEVHAATNNLHESNFIGEGTAAKLSDFGFSKVMNLGESCVSSEVRGTFGYVNPEYQSNRQVSAASDIYSFGIVLLQILSGRKVINMDMKNPKPLGKIARSVMKNGSLVEFADPKLHGEYSVEAFGLIFELALLCTGHERQRPSIRQVIVKLEEALSLSM